VDHWLGRLLLDRPPSLRSTLSENSDANYAHRYQAMLAARQQDLDTLRVQYRGVEQIIRSTDGLQPEKWHEARYVALR
jgi:hypothetical protein